MVRKLNIGIVRKEWISELTYLAAVCSIGELKAKPKRQSRS
jgi:hypothetical protein